MLVLARKVGQRILIGDQVAVTIVRIGPGLVRVGIEAPENMPVIREELKARLDAADAEGVQGLTRRLDRSGGEAVDGNGEARAEEA